MAGFLGQNFFAGRVPFEMPVGTTTDAIRLPDGRYAVPLPHLGKVQIYSADLHFLFGWPVEAGGGVFTLLPAPQGRLEIFTARGKHDYVFDPDGSLISSRVYDFRTRPMPGRSADALTLRLAYPWWKFPLLGPGYSWMVFMSGMLVIFATTTRAERRAQRRANRIRAARPGGAIRRVVGWIAAAFFTVFGFIWFIATGAMLIRAIHGGHVLMAIVIVPFFVIGVLLLFLSITIIRTVIASLAAFLRRNMSRT